MYKKNCKNCKQVFIKKPTKSINQWIKNSKFCSLACYWESKKGISLSKETKEKIGKTKIGNKSHFWKDGRASYRAIHNWIQKKQGRADYCELCGLSETPKGMKRYFDWSNKSRQYLRDEKDWWQLCKKCHKQFDKIKH